MHPAGRRWGRQRLGLFHRADRWRIRQSRSVLVCCDPRDRDAGGLRRALQDGVKLKKSSVDSEEIGEAGWLTNMGGCVSQISPVLSGDGHQPDRMFERRVWSRQAPVPSRARHNLPEACTRANGGEQSPESTVTFVHCEGKAPDALTALVV